MDVYASILSRRSELEEMNGNIIFREVTICCLNVSSEMPILCAYVVSKCDSTKVFSYPNYS